MSGHGITWDQVRAGTPADLEKGVTFVVPSAGTAYWTSSDGTVRGHGWQPLDGIAWTVRGVTDEYVRLAGHEGQELVAPRPSARSTHVLLIVK
ncbi:MAG TPA: hypothetical protein VFU47_12650 [Armatimonadota bacterium]|nr:hypothetical protein [Armatimonadota bacterium]